MLDIPELDDFICRQLNRDELAQCARVSKKWHSIVVPSLWSDLSGLSRTNTMTFCRIVLEDYLAEQQRQKLLVDENDMEQALPPSYLSTLSKYGHFIRMLPALASLLDYLPPHVESEQDTAPTTEGLLRHLFKCCSPNVQVKSFRVYSRDLDLSPGDLMKTILDFSLPRLSYLFIQASFHVCGPFVSTLVELLNRCSTTLRKLELNIDISCSDVQDDPTEDEPSIWISLEELVLHRCIDTTNTKIFWSWLLRRCSNVKRLRVGGCVGVAQTLAEGMLAHMPNLSEITLGRSHPGTAGMADNAAAKLLAASRNGWKRVHLGPMAVFQKALMDALAKHFSTLEVLDTRGCGGVSDNEVVQALSSCTNLHALLNTNSYPSRNHSTTDAKVFIDLDSAGLLRPWKCEATLKELKVTIAGIPRFGLRDGAIEETYPGEGYEIQGRVYDRLARLTNLEILWLGEGVGAKAQCLEMSLESGLDKLAPLKKLKELNVACLDTRIGVKEVQWMIENWPRLRFIYGLGDHEDHGEALSWLQENYPGIKVLRYSW
ncbi:MAG: hypothetical protein J3Q66DRAFT_351102 [Benniella sp.]|nr:MAG: hypothetical protein J3Q66DRAFT_351102 [Benniella sp.]